MDQLSTDQRVNAFAQNLSRSTTQIKADRAMEIAELEKEILAAENY